MQLDIFKQQNNDIPPVPAKNEKELSEVRKLERTLIKIEDIRDELSRAYVMTSFYESGVRNAVRGINEVYGAGFASYLKSSFPDSRGRFEYNVSILNARELTEHIDELKGIKKSTN